MDENNKLRMVIELPKEERQKLSHIFKTPVTGVSQALTFCRNGDKHQRIRLAAMRNGGKLLVECKDWTVEMLKQ